MRVEVLYVFNDGAGLHMSWPRSAERVQRRSGQLFIREEGDRLPAHSKFCQNSSTLRAPEIAQPSR